MHATPRFAAVLLAASFAVPLFAQTPAWEAPKGGYDTPATFATRIEDAGTVYTRVLGEARKNVYGESASLLGRKLTSQQWTAMWIFGR